ncbi:hypothetical protein ACWD6P_21520 [Streptomyces sp. NPDC002446]
MRAGCAANPTTADTDVSAPPNYGSCTRIHELVAASSQLLQFPLQRAGDDPFDELDIPAPNRLRAGQRSETTPGTVCRLHIRCADFLKTANFYGT